MERVEKTTTVARVILEDGVVSVIATGTMPSTADTVVETLSTIADMADGKRVPILFDATEWPAGDPASWVTFIRMIEQVCIAAAVVIPEAARAALGDYPSTIDTILIPFRVFSKEADARAFLADYEPV